MFFGNLLVVLFGLVIGSFLNVCIYRIPRSESLVRPRSRCPRCDHPIRGWENIPVLSYLLLRGRCRHCKGRLGWVYPTVEILTAAAFLLLHRKFGFQAPFFVNAGFFCLLIPLIFIDLYHRVLPNVITLRGLVVGFLVSPLQAPEFLHPGSSLRLDNWYLESYLNSGLGIVIGGGFLWLVAFLYLRLRRIEGLGLGDVKMMGMIGAFLGWQLTWATIFLGSVIGVLVGGAYICGFRRGRMYELPFGSFLGLGALVVTLGGTELLVWYSGLLASS